VQPSFPTGLSLTALSSGRTWGKLFGTKGETSVKVVANDGHVITAYPVK
jgi:hypothetical protein